MRYLLLVPVVDVVLLFFAARVVGGWPVLGFVAVSAVVGVLLARRAAPRIMSGLVEARHSGRAPIEEMVRAALVTVSGALLAWPGIMTSVAGLGLLLPPVRALMAAAAGRWVERRVSVFVAGPQGDELPPRDVIDIDPDA